MSLQLFCTVGLVAVVAQSEATSALAVDLSFQPRLPVQVFERVILDSITSHEAQDRVRDLRVDLSSSELTDSDIEQLLISLSSSLSEDVNHDWLLRTNRLSPKGVSLLLKHVLGPDEGSSHEKGGDNASDVESGDAEEPIVHPQIIKMGSLDLSWNNLHVEEPGAKTMMADLRKLVENSSRCPKTLSFNRCSLGSSVCRSIGKGIVNRYKTIESSEGGLVVTLSPPPLALHLCGNPDLGDAGAAALAAAIRGRDSKSDSSTVVFSTLDLSACNIGDAGAEAIAIALESHPGCIERLILSNNKITNSGATSIAQAMAQSDKSMECLELDNNPGIGNSGAAALAKAVGKGSITNLSLRSCGIKADGAKAFGMCLSTLGSKSSISCVNIDLSGNPLGLLMKKKKESLHKKASTTTASYMNFIGKQIKSGLKDVGLDSVLGTSTVESDDDEDECMGHEEDVDEPTRCGAKAFASAIVLSEEEANPKSSNVSTSGSPMICKIGMRRCFLDQGAGDALAATIVQAKERLGIHLEFDVDLNYVLEDDMVSALGGSNPDGLDDMMDRHMETLEAIRIAEERAYQAASAAISRNRQAEWDDDEDDYEFGVVGSDTVYSDVEDEDDEDSW